MLNAPVFNSTPKKKIVGKKRFLYLLYLLHMQNFFGIRKFSIAVLDSGYTDSFSTYQPRQQAKKINKNPAHTAKFSFYMGALILKESLLYSKFVTIFSFLRSASLLRSPSTPLPLYPIASLPLRLSLLSLVTPLYLLLWQDVTLFICFAYFDHAYVVLESENMNNTIKYYVHEERKAS